MGTAFGVTGQSASGTTCARCRNPHRLAFDNGAVARGQPGRRREDLSRIRFGGSRGHGGEPSHKLGWVSVPPTTSLTQRIQSCASEEAMASNSQSRSTRGGSIAIMPATKSGSRAATRTATGPPSEYPNEDAARLAHRANERRDVLDIVAHRHTTRPSCPTEDRH